jgi:hypothetical protein
MLNIQYFLALRYQKLAVLIEGARLVAVIGHVILWP